MIPLTILALLTVLAYIRIRAVLNKKLEAVMAHYEGAKHKCDSLDAEFKKLQEGNLGLITGVEEVMGLYNISKDICKSLDEDKVFAVFRERISRFVKINECRFLKDESELPQYSNYTVFPFSIGSHKHRYLAFDRVRKEDDERLHILIGQFILGIKRAVLYHNVQEMAISDSLTGVFSRRYLLERLREELARSKRLNYNFSLLMFDIDYFKSYNDRYGHLVGDAILKQIAAVIKESIRQIDIVGRYGGEEFLVILSETNKEGAKLAAERMRLAIEERPIVVYDESLKVTTSIGVAAFPVDAQDADILIDKADSALYTAKGLGRNKVSACENT